MKRLLDASPDIEVDGMSLPCDPAWFQDRVNNAPDLWVVIVREHAPYSRAVSAELELDRTFRDWLAGFEQLTVNLGHGWYERHDVALVWYRDLVRFGAVPLVEAIAERFGIEPWEPPEPMINYDLRYLMPPLPENA
jgi:hypothetical protein